MIIFEILNLVGYCVGLGIMRIFLDIHKLCGKLREKQTTPLDIAADSYCLTCWRNAGGKIIHSPHEACLPRRSRMPRPMPPVTSAPLLSQGICCGACIGICALETRKLQDDICYVDDT